MLQLRHYSFELPFEYPFTISKGTKTHQPTLIVSLGLRNWCGYGEAPAINYYGVSVEAMIEELNAKRLPIERYALTDPQRFWHFLHHLFPGNNFLIAALDIAGWDLFAQMRNAPLRRILGITSDETPASDYTLGIDTPEKMLEKMQAHSWNTYKIKMRSTADIDILDTLRTHTDKPFRVDANEAFTFEEAKLMLPELKKLGVHLIEQPLAKTEWDAMKELKAISDIPLFADESCVTEKDVARCADSFDGINIKLTKCGGITPAMRMITEARQLGLKIMLGSMNESSIGTAAMVHLSPLVDELDADGPLLLSEDIADGLKYENGMVSTAHRPGMGVRFWGRQQVRSYF
ncbi:MAG: dipeptide epimerase [Chitinophagaceae bacterium]|jgi:L-alanine-DL-glutamate epimerase-like enolase superfamily enzyme